MHALVTKVQPDVKDSMGDNDLHIPKSEQSQASLHRLVGDFSTLKR